MYINQVPVSYTHLDVYKRQVVHSYIVGLANGGNAITDNLFKLLLNLLAHNKYLSLIHI